MKRTDGRTPKQLRDIVITKDYLNHPISSVLIEFGGTKVVCAVSVENSVPPWMRAQNVPGGWLTAEYAMLPSSTHQRSKRDNGRGGANGRSMEIQRLVGRSMRSVVDLRLLGQRTFYIDCDVIDADGGTRCASVTGASVALRLAFERLKADGVLKKFPMRGGLAAVSVGVVGGVPMLDLNYEEDSNADVDMNVVMTEEGDFVELQGTAETKPFSYTLMEEMLALARTGLDKIFARQRSVTVDGAAGKPGGNTPGQSFGSIAELVPDIRKSEG